MNERKLTKLEAAMLGLYLQGMRVVVLDYNRGGRPEYVAGASNYGGLSDRDWCLSERTRIPDHMQPMFDPMFPNWRKKSLVEITPWLTAHNVPIPEVEG